MLIRTIVFALAIMAIARFACADAIAGVRHVIFDGHRPFWVPIIGGPCIPITSPHGVGVDAAYSGDKFFVAGITDIGLSGTFIAEGQPVPHTVIDLNADPGADPPVSVWNGDEFVVAWRTFEGPGVAGARVSKSGFVIGEFEIAGFRRVHGLSADEESTLVVSQLTVISPVREFRISGVLFDRSFDRATSVTMLRTPTLGTNFLRVLDVEPFGGGHYLLAVRGDDVQAQVIGRHLTTDGVLLPEEVLDANGSNVIGGDLLQTSTGLLAVMKRVGIGQLTQTLVSNQRSIWGPQPVSPEIHVKTSSIVEATLINGRPAIIVVDDCVASVTLLPLVVPESIPMLSSWFLVALVSVLATAAVVRVR